MELKSEIIKKVINVSAAGVMAIAAYEGVSTVAYPDPVGIPTICYGYTHNVFLGMEKTEEECVYLLKEEIDKATNQLYNVYSGPITQGEVDAYVSFIYNVGIGSFQKSTLLKKLKKGDREGACRELPKWVYAKGKKLPGLVARRGAEEKICLSGLK